MSETLGAFLVAVTVLLWPAPGRPLAAVPAFALGALAVATSLVTPAAAFVAVPVLGVLAWRDRRSAAVLGLMAAGLFLILAPWQVYLLEKTGRVEPLLLHPIGSGRTGLQMWLRTWSTTPAGQGGLVEPGGAARASRAGPRAGSGAGSRPEGAGGSPVRLCRIRHRQRLRRDVPRGGACPEKRASGPFLDRPAAGPVRDALAGLSFDDRRAGVPPTRPAVSSGPRTGPLTPPSGA